MKWSSLRHSISLFCHEMVILCLRLDHFMTTQTDTMSGASPFHDKTDWYYVWGLTISWQNRLILCLRLHHFMTKQTYTILKWSSPRIVSVCFVMKWSIPRHSVSLLCHKMAQTDTMSGAWSFHDKTDWYYVWGLSISSQNRLMLCLRFDHFMTKQTDTMSEAWPFYDITSLFWHEMV
jgi:hypothetical protein